MVLEKAKRLVEHQKDVIILLDSITRLARAYNTVIPRAARSFRAGSIPTPSTSQAVLRRARNVEEGGSLTIVSTALIDTGSGWTK